MKLCADENVAVAVSDLIRTHLLSSGNTLDNIDDHLARGVDDQIWVRTFADAGGEAIIGADMGMTKRCHEIVAIAETGLRLIILDEKWVRQKKHLQISHLFYWWPHIETVLASAKAGKCFKVPWGWSGDETAIKPITVDLQKAYKQMRKAK